MKNLAYFGLDVHKETNSIHLLAIDSELKVIDQYIGQVKSDYKITIKAIKTAIEKYELKDYDIKIGYESGPTGVGLCKAINKAGYTCEILATSTIPHSANERIKTDRLDAKMIARVMHSGGYKCVYILDDKDIAVRSITRVREDRLQELKRAKLRLASFLLLNGKVYDRGKKSWTKTYINWLKIIKFEDKNNEKVYKLLLEDVFDGIAKVEEVDEIIRGCSEEERYKEKVDKLICFAGISRQIALSICCEIGDFSRFNTPEQLCAYVGLVPSEESSGLKTKRGAITKSGNKRVRTIAIEASKSIKKMNLRIKSDRIKTRQEGQKTEIIRYADKCNKRIWNRIYKLENFSNKNANVACTAGARELICFIWGMMTNHINDIKEIS